MNTRLIVLAGLIVTSPALRAQTPALFYDFSLDAGFVNNLGSLGTDGVLTGGATIGTGGPALGFSGGPGGSILNLDGGDGSFVNTQLAAGILGFTSDNYTSGAWIRLTSFGGDSMIFGQRDNTGVDAYLHNGVRGDNPHLGHWGNDTTGSTNLNATFGTGNWFHLAFRYRGDEQAIFVNGQLVAREFRGNLPSNSNVLIGSSNNGGGVPGSLDDVVVYNSSLRANQIEFLAAGGNPNALPAPAASNAGYLGALNSISPATIPEGPSTPTGSGRWGVQEIASSDANRPDNLTQAVDVLRNPPAGSTIATGFTDVINRRDPESGASHFFAGDTPFLTNTAADDNRRAFLYRAKVRVFTEGDYTFGYHGDDGFALRVGNFTWTSNTLGDQNRAELDFDDPRTLTFPIGTGDANVRGTIHLTPGEHDIELVSWEGVGGGSHELYYAYGSFANDSDTSTWKLLGGPIATITDPIRNVPGTTASGWTVRVSNPNGPTPLNSVADARAALTATGTDFPNQAGVNFNDPQSGGPGSLAGDVPFPKDTPIDDEDFAAFATATLHITVAETYRFGFQGDDGGYLRIVGVGANAGTADNWTIVENATGAAIVADQNGNPTADGDTLWTNINTGNSRTVGDVFLASGDYAIEGLFWERGGGAYWEIFAGDADAGGTVILSTNSAFNGPTDPLTPQLQIVPEPTSVAMLLGGFGALLGFQRLRRRK